MAAFALGDFEADMGRGVVRERAGEAGVAAMVAVYLLQLLLVALDWALGKISRIVATRWYA